MRRYLAAEGILLTELAAASGISRTTITALVDEKGPRWRDPPVSTICAIAKALELDVDFLLERAGCPVEYARPQVFNRAEREAIRQALHAAPQSPLVARLADEFDTSLVKEIA